MTPNFKGYPEAKIFVYRLNLESGYYELVTAPLNAPRIPNELKIEPTQRNDIRQKADYLIHGRLKDKKYLLNFYTGLMETGLPGYYMGDHAKVVKGDWRKSFILFHLTPDQLNLTLWYCNDWYPVNRVSFVNRLFD